jgi:hypothetical protein
MVTATTKSLESLRDYARRDKRLFPYLVRLEAIRNRIEDECPEAVAWAVAYGRILKLFSDKPPVTWPRDGLEVLVVTTLPKFFDAHVLLAEKVFGPLLLEFGRLTNYQVWTLDEFATATENNVPTVKKLQGGITLFGSPDSLNAISE